MNIGGLGILNRTNSKHSLNVLSWHSPHSLTWRWILALRRHHLSIKPYAFASGIGHHRFLGMGFGQLLGASASRNNDGWQWSLSLLWLSLDFHQQKPMWYRDMYRRQRDSELERDFASQRAPEPIITPDHPTLQ